VWKTFSIGPTSRCTRSWMRNGLVGSKPDIGGNAEQVLLGEIRRAVGGDGAEPLVVAVAEADRDVVLDQHDPVEDAAAHIARALEGIEPAPISAMAFSPLQPFFRFAASAGPSRLPPMAGTETSAACMSMKVVSGGSVSAARGRADRHRRRRR
jgi:hypothetical protein